MGELTSIYFMWKREMIRFFRSKSRVIGSLGMPFFILAILGSGLNGAMSLPGTNGNYMEFITPGVLGMVLLFASVFTGVMVIVDRQFGFLKETLVAPVSRTSIVLGKSIGGATAAIMQGVLMLVVAGLLGVNIPIASVPMLLVIMTITSLAFVSLGIMIASVLDDMHGFQLVMNFLIMPLFFLSGGLFPLNTAPEIVRIISYLDPLTYSVEAMRYLFIGTASIPIIWCIAVLSGFLVLTTIVAAYMFGKIES